MYRILFPCFEHVKGRVWLFSDDKYNDEETVCLLRKEYSLVVFSSFTVAHEEEERKVRKKFLLHGILSL